MAKVVVSISRRGVPLRTVSYSGHDTFLVGRSTDAHLSLPSDKYFSRNHFLIEVNPPRCHLRDLGSSNGTFVNGQKVTDRALQHNDIITAGETQIMVSIEGAPLPQATNPDGSATGAGTDEPPATLRLNTAARAALRTAAKNAAPSTPPAEAAPLAPAIPGYRILREIARGGMGVAYLAEAEKTGGKVAIKTVIPQIELDELHRKMFAREITSLSALRHPHIVNFLESGRVDGVDFYVMELVPGQNLHNYTRSCQNKLPWPETKLLGLQCLDALQYTHEKNIVHRDLKPSNIMVQAGTAGSPSPMARILDFGLAKNYEEAGSITITGEGKGSIPFMPPEQVLNCKNVGPLSDLYSLTAVLYFMLSGQNIKDFPAKQDPIKILLEGPVVPLSRRGVPADPALQQFLDRGLAKDPYRRFASAEKMAQALRRLL